MSQDRSIFGIGMYSIPAAARLTGLHVSRVRRWLAGYDFDLRDGTRSSSPAVFESDLSRKEGRLVISFLDLVELRAASGFLGMGLPWHRIRHAYREGQTTFNSRHPFATGRLKTDGTSFFGKEPRTGVFTHIPTGQAVLKGLEGSFFNNLDYGLDGIADRWWPAGRNSPVKVDPEYSFGAPIIAEFNIPTSALFNAYKANGRNAEVVADWMNVAVADVEAAVDFEISMAA